MRSRIGPPLRALGVLATMVALASCGGGGGAGGGGGGQRAQIVRAAEQAMIVKARQALGDITPPFNVQAVRFEDPSFVGVVFSKQPSGAGVGAQLFP